MEHDNPRYDKSLFLVCPGCGELSEWTECENCGSAMDAPRIQSAIWFSMHDNADSVNLAQHEKQSAS